MSPHVAMIWAQSTDRDPIIGIDGTLPWHVPEDLRYFNRVTQGYVLVMGRKTWDSLPDAYRPLPGRTNIVVSTSMGDAKPDGVITTSQVYDAIQYQLKSGWSVMVIGGGDIFRMAMPLATRLYVTEVDVAVKDEGSRRIYAPSFDRSWTLTGDQLLDDVAWQRSRHGDLRYRHLVFERSGHFNPHLFL